MTAEIAIRPYRADDAEAVFEAVRESVGQIHPWMPWCHPEYSLDDSNAWIARAEETWQQGSEYNFAIVDSLGRMLGGRGLNQIRPEHRLANLGYWVRTSATRRGVATAAVRKLAEFAFRETDLARLEIVVAVGNVPSHGVAQKAGAIAEGLAYDRLYFHGRSHDAIVYALLRSRIGAATPATTTAPAGSQRSMSGAVLAAFRRDFPKDRWPHVWSLLDAYGIEAHEPERERVQLAILKLSAGDERKLREHVAIAKQDYRDILLWADHPDEARIDTPEKRKEMREILLRLGVEPPPGLKD